MKKLIISNEELVIEAGRNGRQHCSEESEKGREVQMPNWIHQGPGGFLDWLRAADSQGLNRGAC